MTPARVIRGAGGGGGKGGGGGSARAPVESPDSLRSRQYARVIDAVSEGEIEGLVDGLKSVFLDDTPVQSSDGSYNFTGVVLLSRPGTQAQTYIPGFPAVEAETPVSAEITAAAPVVRSISNANANAVRVTVSVPRLTLQNSSTGDITGTSVDLAIDVQTNGGGYIAQAIGIAWSNVSASGTLASSSVEVYGIGCAVSVPDLPDSYIDEFGNSIIPSVSYRVEYRKVGTAIWTIIESDTVSAYETSGFTVFSTRTNRDQEKSYSVSDLAYGFYEIQVVKISGSGTPTLFSASYLSKRLFDSISGKTTTRYQRSYRIELTGTGPWDIRLRRLTADSTTSNLSNQTWWDSYTEVIDAKLAYPNTALVALAVDAEQFRAIPRRGYEVKGLKVRIPSNYNPATRVYTGAWDGAFSIAWTDNPAWCFYDLLTNERYGLGAFIDAAQVDKWTLYTIAQYCDELVDDGFGGLEPRFTCNLYLQTREEAYKVINTFASIFRGMVYWAGGAITAVQDAPGNPVALFTPANVIDGAFNYAGSSVKARHTVALVAWNDPDDRYRQKIEYVEDADGIALYGVIQTEVVAVGCTSRGQAHRMGRWMLYTERMETETVSFRTGLEGLSCAPGEIIQTSDPVRAGIRLGGRVVTATTTSLTLDATVAIEAGKTYTLWATLPDGSVESRAVTTGIGSTDVLAVSPAFTAAPQDYAMWVLAASDVSPETWRVISIAEVEGTQAEITALAYNGSKYAAVEQNLVLEPLQISTLRTTPATPTDLAVSESLYLITPVVVGTRLTVSWTGAEQYYELQYRRTGTNWTMITTPSSSIDIQPAEPGVYEFSLVAVNSIGLRSVATTASATVYGLTALPQNVAGFALSAIGGMAHLTWTPATDLDVVVGGHLRIRHTSDTVTPDWSSAVDIGPQIPGTASSTTLPLLAGTYLAKWVDSSGNTSAAAIGIVTDAANVLSMNVVEQRIEHPAFSGVKTGVFVDGGGLVLDSALTIDQMTSNIDTWPRLSALGGISASGEYHFASGVDLGSVQTSRLTAALLSQGFDALDLIDERQNVDSWPSVDGNVITDVGCTIWLRTTPDNPTGTPTWSSWAPFVVGDYSARAFQFKAVLETHYPSHNLRVTQLQVTVDMPDRTENADDIVSGAGTKSITYTLPFMAAPSLGITAQDMATGDYYSIANKSVNGFDITFKNAAGSAVSRTFDWIAKGY